jgi:hypothetical protein
MPRRFEISLAAVPRRRRFAISHESSPCLAPPLPRPSQLLRRQLDPTAEHVAQLASRKLDCQCRPFAVHPSMPNLVARREAGDAAFVANVGTLIEPVCNRGEVIAATKRLPLGLYSHSDQIEQWQTSVPQSRARAKPRGTSRPQFTSRPSAPAKTPHTPPEPRRALARRRRSVLPPPRCQATAGIRRRRRGTGRWAARRGPSPGWS